LLSLSFVRQEKKSSLVFCLAFVLFFFTGEEKIGLKNKMFPFFSFSR